MKKKARKKKDNQPLEIIEFTPSEMIDAFVSSIVQILGAMYRANGAGYFRARVFGTLGGIVAKIDDEDWAKILRAETRKCKSEECDCVKKIDLGIDQIDNLRNLAISVSGQREQPAASLEKIIVDGNNSPR